MESGESGESGESRESGERLHSMLGLEPELGWGRQERREGDGWCGRGLPGRPETWLLC